MYSVCCPAHPGAAPAHLIAGSWPRRRPAAQANLDASA